MHGEKKSGFGHVIAVLVLLLFSRALWSAPSPLASWKEGRHKRQVLDFIYDVTDLSSAFYLKPEERVAVFDMDGTLMVEYPVYPQLSYSADVLKEKLKTSPSLSKLSVTKKLDALVGEKSVALSSQEMADLWLDSLVRDPIEIVQLSVKRWLHNAVHPLLHRRRAELVYEPMRELIEYLREKKFKPYIVTAGPVDFFRVVSSESFGIPPENVIGSTFETELKAEFPSQMLRKRSIRTRNDREMKAREIDYKIGRRPILAFGNSDGDIDMLRYTSGGPGKRLAVLIHHDDATREYRYDRESQVGKLDKGLTQAPPNGWMILSMKDDWKTVFRATTAVAPLTR